MPSEIDFFMSTMFGRKKTEPAKENDPLAETSNE
jgi:hypothetical protein